MCVIVVKEKKGIFPDAEFIQCWNRNKDGLGYSPLKHVKLDKNTIVMIRTIYK